MNATDRLDLLRDVGNPRALSRQIRQMRRQIGTVARGGPLAAGKTGTVVPFTKQGQVAVSGPGGAPDVLALAAGQIVGRPLGGNLGATTVGGMGGLLKSLSNPTYAIKTTGYAATTDDFIIAMDQTAGAATLTLPANPGAAYDGKTYFVLDPDATWTGNTLTIARGAGDTINGAAANKAISADNVMVLIVWHATPRNWNVQLIGS